LATAEDREAGSAAGSEEEGEEVLEYIPEAPPPTMYRWVSSSRPTVEGALPVMVMSFAVPQAMDAIAREAQIQEAVAHAESVKKSDQQTSTFGVAGCTQPRKYRLVKDWTTGACGLAHLKALEGRA
jgi:Ino eighty subunit 2